jgi:hypothetical protein
LKAFKADNAVRDGAFRPKRFSNTTAFKIQKMPSHGMRASAHCHRKNGRKEFTLSAIKKKKN